MLYPFSRLLSPARSRASCGPVLRRKRGFNLIESAIVLGVVGLVIGGIWAAAASVSRAHRVQQTFDGMMYIAQRVNQTFGREQISGSSAHQVYWHGNSPNGYALLLTTQQLIAMDAIPANWTVKSNVLYAPSLNNVNVAVWVDSSAMNEMGWSVDVYSYSAPNKDDCISLGTLILKSLKGSTIVYGAVGGTSYVEALLDRGVWYWWKTGSSGSGLPNPLWAANVTVCDSAEIAVSRP